MVVFCNLSLLMMVVWLFVCVLNIDVLMLMEMNCLGLRYWVIVVVNSLIVLRMMSVL